MTPTLETRSPVIVARPLAAPDTRRPRWPAALAVVLALVLAAAAAWTGARLAPSLDERPVIGGDDPEPAEALQGMPLAIVENRGQADGEMRFYAQGSHYGLAFFPDQVLLSFEGPSGAEPGGPGLAGSAGMALALRFTGGDPDVVIEGQEPTGGRLNFLRGDDPDGWYTQLPVYGGVAYRRLWPGIDVVLRGEGTRLKYEFHVQPGADPAQIGLAYAGADSLALDGDGALVIATPVGELRDAPPVSWQVVGGERVPVGSRYVLGGDGDGAAAFGFALSDYDPDHPLVIDPGLDYSTFIGGGQGDSLGDMAVDADGNVYVAGWTTSTDFPTTPGAFDRTHNGGVMDVVVSKLSADGSSLVYSTYLGGTTCPGENPQDFAHGIAVDSQGHAYITGSTSSTNFPTTSGAFQTSISIGSAGTCIDSFVTKLNPSGSGLVYSTFLGGASQDSGRGIAIDTSGNAYVAGDTCSQDFPTTSGAFQTARGVACGAFLTKVNAAGSGLVYSTHLGGGIQSSDTSIADRVAIDAAGNAYVIGASRAQNFPTTPGAFQPTHPGGDFLDLFTAYVVKVNTGGTALEYGTFLGGTRREFVSDLAVDAAGHAYVAGSTQSSGFPTTPGVYDTEFTGSSEQFLTRLEPDGSDLVFSTFLGQARGSSIALDGDGNIWLAGGTSSTGAPTTADAFSGANSGLNDAWFGLLDASASQLLYGSYFGGVNNDAARAVALGGDGAVYLGGVTRSFDLPTTQGAFQSTLASTDPSIYDDLFVAKFGQGGGDVDPDPDPPTRTDTWSGEIDREETIRHFANVGERGTIEIDLDWDESRADLELRVIHLPTGTVVFEDQSSTRPKEVSFHNDLLGLFGYDVINTTGRRADYTLAVTSPVPPTTTTPALQSVSVDPGAVTGGEASTGTVQLTAAARPGGETVDLASSDPDVATVPGNVTVPEGQTSATFAINTSSVQANASVTITASFFEATRTAALDVNAEEGVTMASLTLDPTTVEGGGTSTGTATLTGPAPPGGAVVSLISSNTDVATVPPSVTVPAGQTSATFTVSTSPQQFDQSSAISGSHGGVMRTAILSVTAAPPSTDTVTIERARYQDGELEVRAASSQSGVTLTVYVTATEQLIGTLGSDGRGEFDWPTNPQNITVRSSSGGSATSNVST